MKTAQHKRMGHPVTPILGIGIGIAVCLLLSLILSATTAWLVSGERLPQNAISGASALIHGIAAFAGCLTAMFLTGNMPAIIAAVCAGSYFAFLVCMNVLILNSSLGGVGKGFAAILGGAVLAIAVSILGKGNRKRKKPKIR